MIKQQDYELSRIATFLGVLFILWLIFALFVNEVNDRSYLRGDFDY